MTDSENSDDDAEAQPQGTPHGDGKGPSAAAAAAAAPSKKKKSKSKAKKKRKELDAFFEHALAATAAQVAGVSPERIRKVPDVFRGFGFTGALRPAYVTPRMTVPPSVPKPDHADEGQPLAEQAEGRFASPRVYSPEEIERVRKAVAVGVEVLGIAGKFLRAGVTGDEIDRVVYTACVERGAYPTPLNYYNFPKSVCVSVNEVVCHGIPDCQPIRDGDIVNIDVSVYYEGMHADLNETFMVGNVDKEGRQLVKTAWECLQAASKVIKPGTFYRDVGNEIQRVADKNKMAICKRYCGHGCGHLLHTRPDIHHYKDNKALGIMRAGHIFTIEPMINLGGVHNTGDVTWPDKWTAVTRDGSRSSQFEHMFLVTETGFEILTARPGTDRFAMVWDGVLEAALNRPGDVPVIAAPPVVVSVGESASVTLRSGGGNVIVGGKVAAQPTNGASNDSVTPSKESSNVAA